MRTMLRKWGKGAVMRISAAVMRAANLNLDQEVDVRDEEGCVVIAPLRPISYALASLLDGITEDNLHEEVLTGDAVGLKAGNTHAVYP